MDDLNDRFRLKFRDGRILETTRSTLCAVQGSVLDVMFRNAGREEDNNALSAKPDADGTYFFDRDADVFNALLNRLVAGGSPDILQECPLCWTTELRWKAELEYWGLLPLPATTATTTNTKKRKEPTADEEKERLTLTPEVEAALEIIHRHITAYKDEWKSLESYRFGKCSLFTEDMAIDQNSPNAAVLERAGITYYPNVAKPQLRLYCIGTWLNTHYKSILRPFYEKKLAPAKLSIRYMEVNKPYFFITTEQATPPNKKTKQAEVE
jgi:hypothetical protein